MVFRSMALGMILSVVAVAFASLTLLPAVLAALGSKVLVTKGEPDMDRAAEGRWTRWTAGALKRPAVTLVLGLTLLLGLAVPALGMRLGMPGARVVDEGYSSRDGYELVVGAFGEGAAAPVFVTVDAGEAESVAEIARADANVVDARLVGISETSGRAAVRVTGLTAARATAISNTARR
jgi:RND superfamily putative drug exporter